MSETFTLESIKNEIGSDCYNILFLAISAGLVFTFRNVREQICPGKDLVKIGVFKSTKVTSECGSEILEYTESFKSLINNQS